ncbi:hypothetical protein GO491_06470 [Flavobacteriaceae bacterium Ap0902]|nr:hypothetical protein [Flavobacteriaceae bacterium Ap0902]
MRKQLKSILFVSVLSLSVFSCSEDKVVTNDELPQEIQTYVQTHFPNSNIVQATMDDEMISKTYEIVLENNMKLEFDSDNNISEIDSSTELPDSVVPTPILEYVKTNYPNNKIMDMDIDDNKQSVELDNQMELEFDKDDGQFLKID